MVYNTLIQPENAARGVGGGGQIEAFKTVGGGAYLVSTNTIIVYNLLT